MVLFVVFVSGVRNGAFPLVSLIVTCLDLTFDLLCALTLVVGPIEAFVMVTAIDLSDFGI
jgi:hypothetical protein